MSLSQFRRIDCDEGELIFIHAQDRAAGALQGVLRLGALQGALRLGALQGALLRHTSAPRIKKKPSICQSLPCLDLVSFPY